MGLAIIQGVCMFGLLSAYFAPNLKCCFPSAKPAEESLTKLDFSSGEFPAWSPTSRKLSTPVDSAGWQSQSDSGSDLGALTWPHKRDGLSMLVSGNEDNIDWGNRSSAHVGPDDSWSSLALIKR